MADKKISDFPTLTSVQSNDLLLVSSLNETYNVKAETFMESIKEDGIVLFDTAQSLTDAQKAQARSNINAVSTSDQNTLSGNVVHVDAVQSFNDAQKQTARTNISAASLADIGAIGIDDRLLNSMIKGTRQVVVMTNGAVTGVNHVDSSNNNHIVRADTFAVESDPMVETRTLDTGERLTISTDLTTLTSTITYTPASA